MLVFLWDKKWIFSQKTFSAECKSGSFSVIPARSLGVIFKMAWTVPPSFVDHRPKLRVIIIAKWEWPKVAKNQGEPQKMTHSSETEFFFGVF